MPRKASDLLGDARLGRELETDQYQLREEALELALRAEAALGVRFYNRSLLLQALVHPSYINDHPEFPFGHNQRLEFLGDAVIELVVKELLFRSLPDTEGMLTELRSRLADTASLGNLGQRLNLDPLLLMHHKDRSAQGSIYRLACAFEALCGALFLDQGYEAARRFLRPALEQRLGEISSSDEIYDPKSRLQDLTQAKHGTQPKYVTLEQLGATHSPRFVVAVFVQNQEAGRGEGTSLKRAQEAAARQALGRLSATTNF